MLPNPYALRNQGRIVYETYAQYLANLSQGQTEAAGTVIVDPNTGFHVGVVDGNGVLNAPVTSDSAGALWAGGSKLNSLNSLVSGAGNFVGGLVAGAGAAAANTALIQAALNNAGLVQVPPNLGDVYINATLTISSFTEFVIGTGTRIRLTGGAKNMVVNTNWNAPMKAISSVTSADGKTVTVQFAAAHGFTVGSYFFLIGCVPDTYNGVWPVRSVSTTTVPNDTLTFTLSSHLGTETPLITSPATVNPAYAAGTLLGNTTILASAADARITIRGGSWYWDTVANTGGAPYLAFGMYLRRIANLTIKDVDFESCRNPFVPTNIYGGYYDNLTCRNIGSLIQHSGSCRGIKIGTVRGDAWDDHTTFLIGDGANLADITNGCYYGDMDEIDVDLVQAENAYRWVKLVGQTNFKFGSVRVGRCQGRSGLGAAAMFSVQDDTTLTTMAGTAGASGTYIENLTIENLSTRDPAQCHILDIQNATIQSLKTPEFYAVLATTAGTVGISITNGATIGTWSANNITMSCGAYSGNPFAIFQDATVTQMNIKSMTVTNIGYPIIQGTNIGAAGAISVGELNTINCGQGVVIKKGGTKLYIGNAIRNGYQASPWLQLDGNADVDIPAGRGLFATDAVGGSAGNKAFHNFLGIGVDVGGAGIVRQANAIGVHRTSTARGTLVDNNIVVCDATNAANSWKQLSDTTKTY